MYTQSNAEDIGAFQEDALSAAAVVEAVNASGASVDQADRSGKATGLALLQAVAFNCN